MELSHSPPPLPIARLGHIASTAAAPRTDSHDTVDSLDDCQPRSAAIHRSPIGCGCAGGTDPGRLQTLTVAGEMNLRCVWRLSGSTVKMLKFVQPNVRVKPGPTAWRAGRQAQNGPQAQRLTAGVPRCWGSA